MRIVALIPSVHLQIHRVGGHASSWRAVLHGRSEPERGGLLLSIRLSGVPCSPWRGALLAVLASAPAVRQRSDTLILSLRAQTNQQVPALCVANGRRDAGAHVTGTLTAWDRVTSDQADAIAVVHFTNEASAVGQVSACIASGAKACILVHESAPLQRFAGKDLEALSVPVAIVNVAMPVGECATLKVDAVCIA